MTLRIITDAFVNGRVRRGSGMVIERNSNTSMSLRYRGGNQGLIAEIYERKDLKNFRLRIHPSLNTRYGRNAHSNRIHSVFLSVGGLTSSSSPWARIRYTTFIHYWQKVYDNKLNIEYRLLDKPLEFICVNGELVIDYELLEAGVTPPKPTTPIESTELETLNNKLTAIIQEV